MALELAMASFLEASRLFGDSKMPLTGLFGDSKIPQSGPLGAEACKYPSGGLNMTARVSDKPDMHSL